MLEDLIGSHRAVVRARLERLGWVWKDGATFRHLTTYEPSPDCDFVRVPSDKVWTLQYDADNLLIETRPWQ